jgi:hypothetical protein
MSHWRKGELIAALGSPLYQGSVQPASNPMNLVYPYELSQPIPGADQWMRWECGCTAVTGLSADGTWVVLQPPCHEHLSSLEIR